MNAWMSTIDWPISSSRENFFLLRWDIDKKKQSDISKHAEQNQNYNSRALIPRQPLSIKNSPLVPEVISSENIF